MTLALNPAGLPELDIPGMIAMLKAQGYRVSKPKAAAADEPISAGCVHCGGPIRHRTALRAGKTKRQRVPVGLCDPCYRFGPRMTTIPIRPSDPARHERLMRVWRRAHNRFARRRRVNERDPLTYSAERLAGRLLAAITNEPTERDYVSESKIPGMRGGIAA